MIAAVIFWALCCFFSLQRYFNFYPTGVSFDQGIFNQVYWNSLHGRWFESSLSSTEAISVLQDGQPPEVFYRRLGQHFTPALMLWLPFYALFPSPAGLSVLQITLITAGGWVLYALARHYHPPHVAALFAIAYFCANAVIAPAVSNFHDLCQIPLFVFGALLAMEKRRWWVFWLLIGLTLAVREDTGIILLSIGVYLLLSRRFPWVGMGVCALSVAYMAVITNLVMPLFSDDVSRRFVIEQFGQFVNTDEASTLDLAWAVMSNPWRFLVELVTPVGRTLQFLLGEWVPLAFVPVLSPSAWVLAGFPMMNTLLRQDPAALSLHLRYAIALVPGLFYGAILWWAAHPHQFQPRTRRFWLMCMALALVLTIGSNPNRALSIVIPDSFQPWVYVSPAQQWSHAQQTRSLLAQIPAEASVSATSHVIAHLSNRREAVRYPEQRIRGDDLQEKRIEYVVMDLWYPLQAQAAFEGEREGLLAMSQRINTWLERQIYGLIDFKSGVALLRRRAPSNPDALAEWAAFQQLVERTLNP